MQGLATLQLDRILFRDLAAANARYEAFSKHQADERIAKGESLDAKDVFYFLQKGKHPETGEGFTLHELVAEASLLILGGKCSVACVSNLAPQASCQTFWHDSVMCYGKYSEEKLNLMTCAGTIPTPQQLPALSSTFSTMPPSLPNSIAKSVLPSHM